MKTILCTTGTSIAAGCKALGDLLKAGLGWDDDTGELDRQLRDKLQGLDWSLPDVRIRASAELNSLHRMGVDPDDTIVLFATDTAEGRVCAFSAAECIRAAFRLDEKQVKVVQVKGLQVRDGRRLREEGLPAFLEQVLDHVGDASRRYGAPIYLNPTGGYKGVVPFLSAIGMIFHLPTFYVFEFSDTLIRLPPLPVSFDLHLYERALPALGEIYRDGGIREEQFYHSITDFQEHERDLFSGFIEVDEGVAGLSPLAYTLYTVQQTGARTVRLSPAAAKLLEQKQGMDRVRMEQLLHHVSDPLWRSIHIHRHTTDLEVYKQGSTGNRIAGLTRQDVFFACLYYDDHDDYVRYLGSRRAAEFDLGSFVDWVPSMTLAEAGATLENQKDERLAALETRVAELEGSQNKVMQQRIEKAKKKQSGKDSAERAKLRSENLRLKERLVLVERKEKAQEQELATARMRIAEYQNQGRSR